MAHFFKKINRLEHFGTTKLMHRQHLRKDFGICNQLSCWAKYFCQTKI